MLLPNLPFEAFAREHELPLCSAEYTYSMHCF